MKKLIIILIKNYVFYQSWQDGVFFIKLIKITMFLYQAKQDVFFFYQTKQDDNDFDQDKHHNVLFKVTRLLCFHQDKQDTDVFDQARQDRDSIDRAR